MRAAGQVDRDAIGHGGLACRHGRPGGTATALHHFRRPRKADLALPRRIQPAGADGTDVVWRMGQQQRVVPGTRRLVHDESGHLGQGAFAQQAVFAHWKPMARRQRKDEVIGIEGLHEHV